MQHSRSPRKTLRPFPPRSVRAAHRVALIAALWFAAACATPPPPVASKHESGVVRAESRVQAERFGDLVSELQPRVVDALPGTLDRPTEVWVQRQLRHRAGPAAPDNVKGYTLIGQDRSRGRIHVRSDTEYPEWFIAHELVHALVGPEWHPLPGVLEEGLCDAVAALLNPHIAPRIRALRAIEASMYFGRMRLVLQHSDPRSPRDLEIWFHYESGSLGPDVDELLAYDTLKLKQRFSRVPDALYGLGFVIATRIAERGGIATLHSLCKEATLHGLDVIPSEWLMAAAGLDADADHARAPYELIGPAELLEWMELLPGFHANLVVQLFHPSHQRLTAADFLEEIEPRVLLASGESVRLSDVPGFSAEFSRRWREATSAVGKR